MEDGRKIGDWRLGKAVQGVRYSIRAGGAETESIDVFGKGRHGGSSFVNVVVSFHAWMMAMDSDGRTPLMCRSVLTYRVISRGKKHDA